MNTILITGSAGFIGSHLAEDLLAKGNRVCGIDNFDSFYPRPVKEKNLETVLRDKNFTFIEGDICHPDDLNKLPGNINTVVHLAAKAGVRPSIENPDDYIRNNIAGTNQLLTWMKNRNIKKLVFASSSSVYGNNKNVPFNENAIVDYPISPYAATKKSCELLNHSFHHLYQVDVINLRLFTVYGPRQRPDLAIRKFIELIRNNEQLPIFGDGNTGRDYTYIGDIVNGIAKSIEYLDTHSGIYETINLGNSSPIKLIDLVTTLYSILKKPSNIRFLPMQQGDVEFTYADISKAKSILNYHPQTSLTEGLNSFIDWYENN